MTTIFGPRNKDVASDEHVMLHADNKQKPNKQTKSGAQIKISFLSVIPLHGWWYLLSSPLAF